MSTLTENYGLEKPDAKEFYDVNVFNRNADIIDEALKKSNGVNFNVENNILNATNESGASAQIADKPTLDEILALLENTAYGLNALKNIINGKNVDLTPVTSALNGKANESTLTATKALLENSTYGLNALKNTVGLGCVKGVQRGFIKSGSSPSGILNGVLHVDGNSPAPYIDVTINTVNMNKSLVVLDTFNSGTRSIHTIGWLTSGTNLRIFFHITSSTDVYYTAVSWQVIEFY